ncbi:MAG TPA: RNA 2',3'-cyclic phosphodiesterase [Mycobacteriales bacterium]|nr:RNA 2',3'-cyclic phosphodiesterase [Mycobacteriales bacterium]
MRLFVAVVPPARALAGLDEAIGVREEQLRWVPPEQWHLTLVFCGEVAERHVGELTERLGRAAARTAPFDLRLVGAGTFPKQAARARVFWTGLGGDVTSLSRLAERCAAAARRTGIDVEERPYRPHLTLARARRDPVDARDAVSRLSSYDGEPWTVSSIRLVHSTLGASVRHETLAEPVLSGGQGPR